MWAICIHFHLNLVKHLPRELESTELTTEKPGKKEEEEQRGSRGHLRQTGQPQQTTVLSQKGEDSVQDILGLGLSVSVRSEMDLCLPLALLG